MALSGSSTTLRRATVKGDMAEAQRLLDKGVDVNEGAGAGKEFPLGNASSLGRVHMAQLLMDRGADVEAATKNGLTALMLAASYGRPETVRFLLERGANPERRDANGENALDHARRYASYGNVDQKIASATIRILQSAAMKEAVKAAREEQRRKMEEEQADIRRGLDGVDIARPLDVQPENGLCAEALTEALIRAKNKKLPALRSSFCSDFFL